MNVTGVEKSEYETIVDIWEASVRATHTFLPEEDIQTFRPLILNEYLDAVELRCARDDDGSIAPPPEPTQTRAATERALAYADEATLAEYARWAVGHRQDVFRWQLWSSRVIFGFVHLLVFAGVVFSGIQFWRSMRTPWWVKGGGEEVGGHIELSAGGVKITSPVLGVIILGLSLAFFYLYLVYVYPIGETF